MPKAHQPSSHLVLTALVVVAIWPALAGAAAPETAAQGLSHERLRDGLATLVLRDASGGRLSLASLRGEIVVVNIWASWCPPCRRELPALDALNTELAKRGGRVVAVSIDQDPENARRFAKARALKLPIYVDGPDGIAPRLDLPFIPYTVVLDRSGEVAYASTRATADGVAELGGVARRLLDAKPALVAAPMGSTP